MRLHGLAELAGELFDEGLLAVGEVGGNLNLYLDELVASATHDAFGDPLAPYAQGGTRLRSRRDAELAATIKGRDLDLVAEHGLSKGDRQPANHVVTRSPKELVRLDRDEQVEIARTAVLQEVAFALDAARLLRKK